MFTLINPLLSAIFTLGGVGIWAIRQEGKLTAHEALDTERFKNVNDRHEDIKDRLERIEKKLDRLNGGSSHAD